MTSRELYDGWAGFEEHRRYPYWRPDIPYQRAIRKLGYDSAFLADLEVRHEGGPEHNARRRGRRSSSTTTRPGRGRAKTGSSGYPGAPVRRRPQPALPVVRSSDGPVRPGYDPGPPEERSRQPTQASSRLAVHLSPLPRRDEGAKAQRQRGGTSRAPSALCTPSRFASTRRCPRTCSRYMSPCSVRVAAPPTCTNTASGTHRRCHPRPLHPNAEVDLFAEHEELGIESADLVQRLAPQKERGTNHERVSAGAVGARVREPSRPCWFALIAGAPVHQRDGMPTSETCERAVGPHEAWSPDSCPAVPVGARHQARSIARSSRGHASGFITSTKRAATCSRPRLAAVPNPRLRESSTSRTSGSSLAHEPDARRPQRRCPRPPPRILGRPPAQAAAQVLAACCTRRLRPRRSGTGILPQDPAPIPKPPPMRRRLLFLLPFVPRLDARHGGRTTAGLVARLAARHEAVVSACARRTRGRSTP